MTYQQKDMDTAISQSKANKMFIGGNPEMFGIVQSKLVKGPETESATKDKELPVTATHDPFIRNSVSRSIDRIRDNNNILQTLPDIRLAIEVIIGGILSPKDLMTVALTYTSNNELFDEKSVPLLSVIENYFESSYKLKEELPKMLEDILARTGSYPLATLPETSIDYVINSRSRVTLEHITSTIYTNEGKISNLGFLASKAGDSKANELTPFEMLTVSTESLTHKQEFDGTIVDSCLKLSVVDNFDALKLPSLTRKISDQQQHDMIVERRKSAQNYRMNNNLTYSSEAMISVAELGGERKDKEANQLKKLYPNRTYTATPVLRVKPRTALDRQTVGHPTVIKMPTEAVIPVFSPTDPTDHIGYFIAIDHTGHPVRLIEMDNIYRMIQTSSNSGRDVTGYLLQSAANGMSPINQDFNNLNALQAYEKAVPVYTQMVEAELIDRLERGSLGNGVSLGKMDNVYRIMLARALEGKQTQLLYVPASILAYLAVDFDEYGLGKTLLDDSKTLAALRAMQLFINSMASAKNAITRRTLNATIDPAERNVQKAEELILSEFAKGTHASYPLTNNPPDMINYLQKAGVNVVFDEHPLLPNTKVNVDFHDNQYLKIDTDWDEYLKKSHTMSLGLPIEVVEGAGSADFATQTIYANVMTARRIKTLSEKFCASLSGFVRRYVFNSQILMDELIERIKTNNISFKDQFGKLMSPEEIATVFVESIDVSLPVPDLTSLEDQATALTQITEFYDTAINNFFSSDWITSDDLGELANEVEPTKAFLKAYYVRKWMKENGVLPDLFELVAENRDGSPLINMLEIKEEYMEKMSKTILPLMRSRVKRQDAGNKAVEKATEGLDVETAGQGDYGSDTTSSSTSMSDPLDDDTTFDEPIDTEGEEPTPNTEGEPTDPDGENLDGEDDSTDENK